MNKSLSEITNLWDNVLIQVEERVNEKQVFDYFFRDTYINDIVGDTIYVVAGTALSANVLNSKYYDLVNDILTDITETRFKVVFVSSEELESQEASQAVETKKVSYFKDSKLNPEYTFDTFVVGSFNREASQASVFVAANPGKQFNPLFIYSKSGLGKTHLLHAIGNYITKNTMPNAKILYVHANDFVEEYIKFAKGERESQSLKDYMCSFDVLLFDDVQFMANKVKSQDFFFTIYEKLVNSNKQIVVTSDRQPGELNGIEDRLVTRFTKGLQVKINNPDQNSCVEILRKKIIANNLDVDKIDEAVLYFFADKFSNDVRELEGALNRLIFYAINYKCTNAITMEVAIEAVGSMVGGKSIASQLNEQKIINVVADYYNLAPSQLTGKIRTGQIALARHIAMYLIRNTLDIPLKKIGDTFGGKDHTTVMSGIQKVDRELKTDPALKEAVEELQKRLKQ